MENRIRELATQIQAIKSKSVRPRYPAALKQAVLTVYRGAKRRQELLKELGVGYTTVAVWLKADTTASKLPEPIFKSVSVSSVPSRDLGLFYLTAFRWRT